MDIDANDILHLAEQARSLGYNKERAIERMKKRIIRDAYYINRRAARGTRTSHDDTLAEDVAVTALAILLLEETQ